jgi:2-methylisocitrate lyase-like PEP mutase family enzyme
MSEPNDLESRCERLRSLHVPGTPLVLPNAWDLPSARAVAAAGFPVVATTSGGVAASLGSEDHERAGGDAMLAAAARIATGVNVPVTVDAEAGYRMEPADLVARLKEMGAAGCNLEDTNHATGELRDPVEQADSLRAVRRAASDQGYGLVINARIDVFLSAFASGAEEKSQAELVSEALRRAHAYVEAGADCVFPILLWEPDALESFTSEAPGPVNVLQIPPAPSHAELAELGVARISYGGLLHRDAVEQFGRLLESLPGAPADEQPGPHELHHIDGNPANNRPDNLIMLRRDCHRRVGRDPSRSRPDRAS